MFYENKIINDLELSYKRIESDREKMRIDIAVLLYDFYTLSTPNIKQHIIRYMRDSEVRSNFVYDKRLGAYQKVDGKGLGLFSEQTTRIFPKLHYDIINKTLDLTCTLYNSGADRYLTNDNGDIDEEQTHLLLELYEDAKINKKIKELYKQGYFYNCVLANPVKREVMEVDIIQPCFFTVKPKPNNYEEAEVLYIMKVVNDKDYRAVWTNEQHYYLDDKGKIQAVPGNENYINPYKTIPFAKLKFKDSCDYYGEPQLDLVEQNVWLDIRGSNNLFVEMFQGMGVGTAINLGKSGEISISPNMIIAVDNAGKDNVPPSLTFESTNAPLGELRANFDYYYKTIGNSKSLSAQSFSNEAVSQSGVAKAFDNQEMETKRQSHKDIMIDFERDLFKIFRIVYNKENPKTKLNENLKFNIDIIEPVQTMQKKDEIMQWDFEFKNGLKSKVDYLIYHNPDLTIEQAEKLLINIQEQNKKYGTTSEIQTSGTGADGTETDI
jgi:hypothetical protein